MQKDFKSLGSYNSQQKRKAHDEEVATQKAQSRSTNEADTEVNTALLQLNTSLSEWKMADDSQEVLSAKLIKQILLMDPKDRRKGIVKKLSN